MPFGYGFAWFNYQSISYTCFPVPINHIARWGRNIYLKLARGKHNALLREAYERGRDAGRREAFAEFGARVDRVLHRNS